jgi:soluble cytochrome b562
MKRLLLLTAIFFPMTLASVASAETLKDYMQTIGMGLRNVAIDIQDGVIEESSLDSVLSMQEATAGAKELTPAVILSLPTDEQQTQLQLYQGLMQDLAAELVTLKETVEAGDVGLVMESLRRLSQIRAQGHTLFKSE